MSKIGVQQSLLCYNLNHYKNKQLCHQRSGKRHTDTAHQQKRQAYKFHQSTTTLYDGMYKYRATSNGHYQKLTKQ